jgi:hypothetical protein
MKMKLKGTFLRYEFGAQDQDHWWAFLNAIIKLRISVKN